MGCEYLCQKWHISKPTDYFDFNPTGLGKLIDHIRKYENTVIKNVQNNVFRADFVREMSIYDRVKEIGKNNRIFYKALSIS